MEQTALKVKHWQRLLGAVCVGAPLLWLAISLLPLTSNPMRQANWFLVNLIVRICLPLGLSWLCCLWVQRWRRAPWFTLVGLLLLQWSVGNWLSLLLDEWLCLMFGLGLLCYLWHLWHLWFLRSYRLARLILVGFLLLLWGGSNWLLSRSMLDTHYMVSPRIQTTYMKMLRCYTGTHYVWGGESLLGVDCSGLARAALVNSMALEGIAALDFSLLRWAKQLWLHDSTANELSKPGHPETDVIMEAANLNDLDYQRLARGDMAVTQSGVHLLVYLGEKQWIEADPVQKKVIILQAPSESIWFSGPMRIVRWKVMTHIKYM